MCLGTIFEIYLIYINYWVVETPISYRCKANDVNSSPSYLENLLIEKRLSPEEGRAFLIPIGYCYQYLFFHEEPLLLHTCIKS